MQYLFINGHIFTADKHNSMANAMVVENNKIRYAGDEKTAREQAGTGAEVVDLQGHFVAPGFIDAHLHLMLGGLYLNAVQLGDVDTPQAFIKRIAEYVKTKPKGTWIRYGAWDHENWGGPLPDKTWIDSYTPDHPVWVTRLDGHTGLANSLALQVAGINKNTQSPQGGTIEKDTRGEPTGILRDNAMELIEKHIPHLTEEDLEQGLNTATDYLHALGITSVHHLNLFNDSDIAFLDKMHAAGKLRLRTYVTYPLKEWHALASRISVEGTGDEWLRVGGLKGFADGSLGSRTAAFIKPYKDDPANNGLLINSERELYELAEIADMHHLQVNIHAIGDRAVRMLLDTTEAIRKKYGNRDHRFRIEHAQHIHPDDVPRFGKLGVIASMQPVHLRYDGRWAHQAVGTERMRDAYPLRRLWDTNATVAFGSDWFVAEPNPLEGIFTAIYRYAGKPEKQNAIVPEERISITEALRGYTINAAYASFEDTIKGSLEPGKLADFIILSENIIDNPQKIRNTKVLETWCGGKQAYNFYNGSGL